MYSYPDTGIEENILGKTGQKYVPPPQNEQVPYAYDSSELVSLILHISSATSKYEPKLPGSQ